VADSPGPYGTSPRFFEACVKSARKRAVSVLTVGEALRAVRPLP